MTHPAGEIIEAVCADFGITREELRGERRSKNIVSARNTAIRRMSKAGMTSSSIGRHLNRDHSTVLWHLKRYPSGYGAAT